MKTRLSADFADSRRLKSERVGSTGGRIPQADADRVNNSLILFEPLDHRAPAAPVAAPPCSLRACARWLRSLALARLRRNPRRTQGRAEAAEGRAVRRVERVADSPTGSKPRRCPTRRHGPRGTSPHSVPADPLTPSYRNLRTNRASTPRGSHAGRIDRAGLDEAPAAGGHAGHCSP